MAHQRHLVKRRLTIKNNVVIVLKVTLYCVTYLKMLIGSVLENRKVNESADRIDDVFSAGVMISASVYELAKICLVVLCYNLWNCEVLSDFLRDSQLIQP